MAFFKFNNVRIAGMSGGVPRNIRNNAAGIATSDNYDADSMSSCSPLWLFIIGILAILLTGIAIYLIGKSITLPVTLLARDSRVVAQGDLTVRINETGTDEIGVLAASFGQIAKLTLELNSEHEELKRIYTEIGRLYYEQAKAAPEGFFVPLFEQANRVTGKIQDKRAKIEALRSEAGIAGEPDIEVEFGDFDDVVSATEADGAGTGDK